MINHTGFGIGLGIGLGMALAKQQEYIREQVSIYSLAPLLAY